MKGAAQHCFGVLLLISAVSLFAALQFTASPTLTKDASNRWWVQFQLSDSTDVTVAIVDPRDSSIIRRLAGGKLGAKAPAPLLQNTLIQRIEWDGKDDLGFTVTNPDRMQARVRAGMSVRLLNLVGDNPYAVRGGFYGMVRGSDGNVTIANQPPPIYQNHWGIPYKVVRRFDRDGNYIRTLYPFPSNLSSQQVQGWGVIAYPPGAYTPVMANTSIPGFSNTILASIKDGGGYGRLMFEASTGAVMFGTMRGAVGLGIDGSMTGTGVADALIKSPAVGSYLGSTMVTPLPGGTHALVSGFFAATVSSGHIVAALDTDFYRDGRVFKVNLSTGAAEVWLDLDTVLVTPSVRVARLQGGEFYAAIHGTAVDNKGRVYVCDRYNGRIGIYDSAATLLGSIPVRAADNIAVSTRTGSIFVLTRIQQSTGSRVGQVRLFKYASFDSGAAPRCSLTITTDVHTAAQPGVVLTDDQGAETRVWVGYASTTGVRLYQDAGSQLTLIRDLGAEPGSPTQGMSRMAVDPRTETVYFNNDWDGFYKIENWSNPVVLPCSTSANRILKATDMTVSPHGLLYVREGGYHGPVTRYTTAHKHVPVNWTNTGANMLTLDIMSRGEGAGFGERGLAVDRSGKVAVMAKGYTTGNIFHVSEYGDSGSATKGFGDVRIFPIPEQSGGVRFDYKGNLYIGAQTAMPAHQKPAAFAADWMYGRIVGAIIKFAAGFDTGSITATAATGAAKVYSVGAAPFSTENSSARCACRSPRFDVDPYGRIFSPNAASCEVAVVDNEDNPLIRFGAYGNMDSRGGLAGPGRTIASPSIPLAYPVSVAASEDFIYVADFGNHRIARLAMDYALDNHPEISTAASLPRIAPVAGAGMALRANPFMGHGSVRIALPSAMRVRLDVFSPAGRLITTVASDYLGAGSHDFFWNGKAMDGRPVAAGAYFLRLRAGIQEIYRPVTLVR